MAGSTKYQAAPQRDSMDDADTARYTEPPPSYQTDPLPAEPRTSEDNVPDDFKV